MANTRDTLGDAATLDALVADTLANFEDDTVTQVRDYGFYNKKALLSVVLPNATNIGSSAFSSCSNLETVDLSRSTGTLGNSVFAGCGSLKNLVLRGSSRKGIAVSLFSDTPIYSAKGALFVPSSLVSEYEQPSSYRLRFTVLPLERYPTSDYSDITDSWDDIVTACGNGQYSTKYRIGDTKLLALNDGEETTEVYMQLVAKDEDVLASDGTTTVPTTWVAFKPQGPARKVFETAASDYSWADSSLRSWLSTTLFDLLPTSLQNNIKTVRKYSDTWSSVDGVVKDQVTADKLWVPSAYELSGSTVYETQGAVYQQMNVTNSTYRLSRLKAYSYATRTMHGSDSANLIYVYSSNGSFRTQANPSGTNYTVLFGFCI